MNSMILCFYYVLLAYRLILDVYLNLFFNDFEKIHSANTYIVKV